MQIPDGRVVPGPECSRFADILPMLEGGGLDAAETRAARANIAECAWCQRQLAFYATVDAGLRRHFSFVSQADEVAPITSMREVLLHTALDSVELADQGDLEPATAVPARLGRIPRKTLSGLGALAAVFALALVAAAVLGTFRGPDSLPSTRTAKLSPALASKKVYLATANGVYALRATDGTLVWRSDGAMLDVIQANGVVYASYSGGGIEALRASDGKRLWRIVLQHGGAGRLALDGDTLYITTTPIPHFLQGLDAGHWIYALRTTDGAERWHVALDEELASAPAVASGAVYVGTTTATVGSATTPNGHIDALRATDGAVLWQSPIGGGAYPQGYSRSGVGSVAITATSNLIFANYVVYRDSDDGKSVRQELTFLELQTSDGSHVVKSGSSVAEPAAAFPPAIDSDYTYFAELDGLGAQRISSSDPGGWYSRLGTAIAGPVLADGTLYASGWDGYTYAIRATDAYRIWRVHTGGGSALATPIVQPNGTELVLDGPLLVAPTVVSDAVFAVGGDTVSELDATTGGRAWTFTVPHSPANNGPVLVVAAPVVG
jgi:outer membrane protein assembly factor BamB